MRHLRSDSAAAALDAPVASESVPIGALFPPYGRVAALNGRMGDVQPPGADGGASSSGSSPSGSSGPSTQLLERILNEPDDEDEDRDEGGVLSDDEDTRSLPDAYYGSQTGSNRMAFARRTRGVMDRMLARHSGDATRAFNPFLWQAPGAMGDSPIDSSLPPMASETTRLGSGALAARGPPEEIDLTVSSDSEGEDAQGGAWLSSPATRSSSATGVVALTDGEEARSGEEDADVQILGSTSEPGAPLRRKRRRPAAGDETVTKRSRDELDTNAAESTAVSLENNDAIEQFKAALKCSICLDRLTDMTSTICGHVFCARCITAQVRINAKCPLCQRRLQLKDIHPLFF